MRGALEGNHEQFEQMTAGPYTLRLEHSDLGAQCNRIKCVLLALQKQLCHCLERSVLCAN